MPYVVERKTLTLLERVYIPQILAGMKVTLKHLFAPNVTMEYPEQRPPIPAGYRGVPTLVMDPNGREKCVSCQLCEFVCQSVIGRPDRGGAEPFGQFKALRLFVDHHKPARTGMPQRLDKEQTDRAGTKNQYAVRRRDR